MNTTSAQTYEAGIMLGGLNYVGDVGSSSFIKPGDYLSSQKIAFGGIFKWNRSPRHSFRFSFLRGETFANDNNAEDGRRSNRRFKFETEITELSAGLEYTFGNGIYMTPNDHKLHLIYILALPISSPMSFLKKVDN